MPLPTLMILDAEARSTLGIVRSLGKMGIPIIAGSGVPLGMSKYSRYVEDRFTYPLPGLDLEAAHKAILQRVKIYQPDILMPVMDPGWSVVDAFREIYKGLTTLVPNPGIRLAEQLFDKARLAELSEQHGMPIPKTFRPKTLAAARALARSLPYPVLLKPRKGVAGHGIKSCRHPHGYLEALESCETVPIIQERLEGEDLELTLLRHGGRLLAGSAYVSLRNAPLPYGPPVACRPIRDEAFMHMGFDFLKKLGYNGVAHLDFRRDKRDGIPKLLDFNTRIAGTNDMSIHSGVNFALIQYMLSAGQPVEPVFHSEIGKEYRWMITGELQHLAQTRHKARTIRELLRFRNVATDISFSDPMPHVARLALGLYWHMQRYGIKKTA